MLMVSGRAINRFRGEAIAIQGRNISWGEIAKKSNLTPATLRNIRGGHSSGSLKTIDALTTTFQLYGVSIDHEDLLTNDPRTVMPR